MQQPPDQRHDAAPPTHENSIQSLSFSSEGRRLASGGLDGWVKVWDVDSGTVLLSIDAGGIEHAPRAVFIPDEPLVVITTLAGAEVRDSRTGTLRRTLLDPEYGFDWIQPTGKGLIVASAGPDLSSWDVLGAKRVQTLARREQTFCCHSASADGRVIAATCYGSSVHVLDLRRGKAIRELAAGFHGLVTDVAVSPDGETVAGGGHAIRLWHTDSGELRYSLGDEYTRFFSLAFSPDGRALASGTEDGAVLVWDSRTRTLLARSSPHSGRVRALAFSPDGKTVATAGDDHVIALLDVATGRLLRRLGHRNEVQSVAFVPGTRLVASGHEDGAVRLWDLRTHSLTGSVRLHVAAVTAMDASPDGRSVASAGVDGTVALWDLQSTGAMHLWRLHDRANDVAFSPDGSRLAVASKPVRGCLGVGTVRVLDPVAGTAVWSIERELRSCMGFGRSARFARSGMLVAAIARAQVHLFSAKTGDLVNTLGPPRLEGRFSGDKLTALAVAPSGLVLALGDCGLGLTLHDLKTGAILNARNDRDGIACMAFSPDGRSFAVGTSYAHHASIRCAVDGKMTAKLDGHRNAITSIAYNCGGGLIATGSCDGSVKLWDAFSGRVVATMRPPET